MIKRLLEKIFGLEPVQCPVCEVLRDQLTHSEHERRELLQRALAPSNPVTESVPVEEFKPLKPQFVPWSVRKQMLEQEDREKARLMRDKEKEIQELEKELGVANAP